MSVRATLLSGLLAAAMAWPAAAQNAQTMLIVDASGSMWGRIGGTPKIAIARDAVRSMLAGWDTSRDIGLVAYGHRQQANCRDIETLIPPGPLNRAQFEATLDALNPIGKTPLIDSVREAAERMGYEDRPASVILVSDGVETCNADPCAAAAALERTGTDFTAHVIGFGIVATEEDQLTCLAEATGGMYLPASNAAELAAAFQTVAAVTPAAAAPAAVVASDEFDGAELGERWTVKNPDETAYIVDGGKLISITTELASIGSDPIENLFLWQGQPLPSGDWDISIDFTSEFTWQKSVIEIGLYQDDDNFVIAQFYGGGSSNEEWYVAVKAETRGQESRDRKRVATASCCPVRYDMEANEANIKNLGATLTLQKRGREYFASFTSNGWTANDKTENPFVVGPVTVLRAGGDPAVYSGTYGTRFGDIQQTTTEIERFTISAR
ncbi:MAG: VWA domain-containing protein [Pseudomonadota bacterium]